MSRQFVIQGIEFRPLMWWGKKSKVKVKQLRIEYDMKSQTAMVGGVFALAPSYQWMWKWKKRRRQTKMKTKMKKKNQFEVSIHWKIHNGSAAGRCLSFQLLFVLFALSANEIRADGRWRSCSAYKLLETRLLSAVWFHNSFFFLFRQIEHGFENARIFITARMRTRKNQWNFASEYLSERACCACWLSNA